MQSADVSIFKLI